MIEILFNTKTLLILLFVSCCCNAWCADTTKLQQFNHCYNTSNPYALVAGGSKGIGYAIAKALAKRNFNLILIARNEKDLQIAKQSLESLYPIHVETISKDLSIETSATEIANWCIENNIQLKVLCNVAGLGGINDYLSIPLDTVQYMVRLNVQSCMALSLTLLPLLQKNSPSYILNVASMAAFAPISQKNVYSATKSAVLYFSYSLRYQLKKNNISVSCLCPGPVFTKPSIEKDTKAKLGKFGQKMAVPVLTVGEIAINDLLKGKMIIVPGTLPKIVAAFTRFLPRRWMASIYTKLDS
ncbi:MAG TPA: SDR family NAD(P)-dependent oxidoreductase [Chitinophagaceae bacterium]|nr:SDR family NAD(P)-dependent oxidoreductase [Chitinophagaceae bacterium]